MDLLIFSSIFASVFSATNPDILLFIESKQILRTIEKKPMQAYDDDTLRVARRTSEECCLQNWYMCLAPFEEGRVGSRKQ